MGRFISGLFGTKQTSPPATALRVSTAIQGLPIALMLGGQARMAVNLIDYFGFASHGGGGGGKGGVAGGGKGQSQTTYSVSFILAVCEGPVAAFTGNWLNGTKNGVWQNLPVHPSGGGTFSSAGEEDSVLGNYTQHPWDFASVFDPTRALAYRGIACVMSPNYNLGSSPSVPQINMEVLSVNSSNVVPGQPDGDASIAVMDFLTNQFYGLGFPSFRISPFGGFPGSYQSYCRALGLAISPVLAAATQASSFLNDIFKGTNSEACWQNGKLTIVPWGDTPVAVGSLSAISETYIVTASTTVAPYPSITVGNVGTYVVDGGVVYFGGVAFTRTTVFPPTVAGTYYVAAGVYTFSTLDTGQTVVITYTFAASASYIPDTTVLYDFTINDFLTNQGSIGSGLSSGNSPVSVVRKPRDQMLNSVKVEYLDRNNNYNPVLLEFKDSAAIVAYKRVRPSQVKQLHFFCLASAAVQSAALQLVREQVARTFQFTVGKHFMLILQLMKIVTVTLPTMGLSRQPVRITEMQENTDGTLTITGEEYPGTASAPIYGTEAAAGTQPNFNADPGSINTPLVFEPTDELGNALISGGGLMLAVAVSGATPLWGGAQVWVSYDGAQYTKVGTITGPSRQGFLTATLPSVLVNQVGQTIDAANTLPVDLSESHGTLTSVSLVDATSLNTRCFVGPVLGQPNAGSGEIVAFQNATLTGINKYNLTNLVRGAYGTEANIAAWPAGTGFARLDDGILVIPFDKSRIGSTVHLKFTSFNAYGGGQQLLSNVPDFTYTFLGTALASPLPTLQNVRTVFQNGRLYAAWDEITDFRGAIRVEIRQGSTYNTALILGTVAHPPFAFPGNGTYWFTAWCQPTASLIVRSEIPVSLAVSGATIVNNQVATFDCKAQGWPGTFVDASVDNTVNAVRVNGGQLIAGAPTPVASNVLHFAVVPNQVVPGLTVTDLTDSGVIPPGTTVVSTTQTTVTLSNPLGADYFPTDFAAADFGTRGVLAGDVIQFGTLLILNGSGTYKPAFTVDVGRVTPTTITISLQGTGVQVGQNILSEASILTDPDILGSASSQFVNVFAEVLISQDGVTYAPPVKYQPGDYVGMAFQFQFSLNTMDPQTIAYLLAAQIAVQVPTRVDHILTNAVLSAAGLAVTFTPDGSLTAAPFNGGPNGATVPHVLATWGDEQAGDVFSVTGLSLTGATFQIVNGGIGVTRSHVNILAEGF